MPQRSAPRGFCFWREPVDCEPMDVETREVLRKTTADLRRLMESMPMLAASMSPDTWRVGEVTKSQGYLGYALGILESMK